MATFMKLDLSDVITKLQKLQDAFNKEKDNLKCFALFQAIQTEFTDAGKKLSETQNRLNFNLMLLSEAERLIEKKDKK